MSTPKQHKDALGNGIRSLLQHIDADLKTTSGRLKPSVIENATGIIRISLDQIETNPKNPRKDFDQEALKQLAAIQLAWTDEQLALALQHEKVFEVIDHD